MFNTASLSDLFFAVFGFVLGSLIAWNITRYFLLLKQDRYQDRLEPLETSCGPCLEIDATNHVIASSPGVNAMFGIDEGDIFGLRLTSIFEVPEIDQPERVSTKIIRAKFTLNKTSPIQDVMLTFQREHRLSSGKTIVFITPAPADKAMVNFHEPQHQRLLDGINSLSDGYVIWDKEDRAVMWNNACLKLFPGLEAILKPGMSYKEIIHYLLEHQSGATPTKAAIPSPETKDKMAERMERLHLACISPREVPLNDGRYLLLKEMRTPSNEIISIFTDITDFKHREAELRANHRLMSSLRSCTELLNQADSIELYADSVLALISETLEVKTVTFLPFNINSFADYLGELTKTPTWSDEATRLLNDCYTRALSAKSTITFDGSELSNEDLNIWINQITSSGFTSLTLTPTKTPQFATHILVFGNSQTHFGLTERELLDALGAEFSRGLEKIRSEADRIEANTALQESEGRYRSLVELSPDAILVLNDAEIVFANPAASILFNCPGDGKLIGINFNSFAKQEDISTLVSPTYLKDGSNSPSELRLVKMDGSHFVAEVASLPITYKGIQALQLVIHDVTERRNISEQLTQMSKLATLGELAASMTHELSQPLNIIRFAAEGTLMKIDRGTSSPEHQHNQFDLIRLQTERMAEIIDHMRVFSRKDPQTISEFDPKIAIQNAIDMVQTPFFAEGIVVVYDFPQPLPKITGRTIQFEQVILNLLSNARDGIRARWQQTGAKVGRDGEITLTSELSLDGANFIVTVQDNGTGLPQDMIDHLFEPFFTTKAEGEGTGLGLSVSAGIIRAMGGQMSASNWQDGAQFEIVLPIIALDKNTKSSAALPLASEHASINSSGIEDLDEGDAEDEDIDFDFPENAPHILVVDDEIFAAEALAEHLLETGYRVSMAGNGEEAFELFQLDPADIVITDMRMPKADGNHLIRLLMEYAPQTAILVMTGHMEEEDPINADLQNHVFAVLHKPVSLKLLSEKIALLTKEFEKA